MGRKRFISPEFFTHSDLYEAERSTGLPLRLAYAGLWTAADRRGLFWWKPRELKLAILPYDDVDFEAILWALEENGFLECYVVDEKRLGRVPAMERWQSFHRNEQPSDAPEPSIGRRESSKGWREPSNGRPTPSPSIAVAVAGTVATAVATTGTTGAADAKRRRALGPVNEVSKYPAFTSADRAECIDVWKAKLGVVNVGQLIATLGPMFRPPDEAHHVPHRAIVMGLRDYCGLVTKGRSAPFMSVADFAKKIGALAENARTHHDDPIMRTDGAMLIVHGSTKVAA